MNKEANLVSPEPVGGVFMSSDDRRRDGKGEKEEGKVS